MKDFYANKLKKKILVIVDLQRFRKQNFPDSMYRIKTKQHPFSSVYNTERYIKIYSRYCYLTWKLFF